MPMSGWNPIFSSLKTSSILIEGPDVVATWALFLSDADPNGVSSLTVPFIAQVLFKGDLDRAQAAMEKLTAPDPHSKNTAYEGRRIITCEEAGIEDAPGPWFLTTHADHRQKMQIERERNRVRQQRFRERKRMEAKTEEGKHVVTPEEAKEAFKENGNGAVEKADESPKDTSHLTNDWLDQEMDFDADEVMR
jgi:hypothetical protein